MIKKFGFYIGIILMAIVLFNININDSYAATEYTNSDGNYMYVEYTNGGVGITTYKGTANVVVIPSTIDGKPVYQIEGGAFCSTLRADANSGITSVTIPSSVTTIGEYVFKDCIDLTSVSLSDGLLTISEGAFENCKTLPTIIIPNTVKSFGNYAFRNCWLLESINIPVGVTDIGSQAFFNCVKLNNVVIPDTMTEISSAVFMGCRALATITLPDTVTNIGNQAFTDCEVLTDINTLLTHVETIGTSAFTNCYGLTTLILPEDTKVTSIGNYAFNGCGGLTSVQLNGASTALGIGVFRNCSNLQVVTLPSSLTSISDELFYECNALETVILPSTVTSIGSSSFINCDALTAVTIPMGVTAIGRYAFQECDGLTEISLPESLTSIDVWALKDCTQLKKITVNSSTTILDANFIEGCHADLAIHGYVGSTAQTYADHDSSTNDANDPIDFVVLGVAPPNNAPTVVNPISDIASATVGTEISIDLTHVFRDNDAGDSLTYKASPYSNGIFITTSSVYKYTPKISDFGNTFSITIRATDSKGVSVEDTFTISVIVGDTTTPTLTDVTAVGDYGKIAITSTQNEAGKLYVLAVLTTDGIVVDKAYIKDNGKIYGRVANDMLNGFIYKNSGMYTVYFMAEDASLNQSDITKVENVVIPERLAITVTSENVTAYGGNDGKITVTVPSGIISEYRTNGSWQSSNVFDNLSAGTYSVIAREKANIDNISLTTSVTITQPNRPSSGGTSSVSLPIKDASTALIEDLIKNGKPNKDGVIEVELKIDADENGKSELELPSNFLDEKVELVVKTDKVNVKLRSTMFTGSEKKITLVVKPKDKELLKLSEEAKKKIGDMPVYDISLKIDGKRVDWKGDEDIEISFNLDKKGKEAHKFVAVYIDDHGNIQFLKSSYYSDGMMHFKTKHLSDYGMIYVDKAFEDSESHWAKEAIEALAVRGIINGTSDATFAPQNNIIRADFITLVVRYFGFTGDNIDSFSDVDSSMYYAESIAIAKDLGIVTGNGDGTFNPTAEITRQDMMVILSRALSVANEDLETSNKSYTSFNDSVSVASYAIESVDYMISTGLINGFDGNINPTGTATRAEVAQLLYNLLIELNK